MKRALLTKLMLLLCALIAGSSSVWAQSDKSAVYTSNVTLSTTGGTSASTCKVVVSSTQYDGIKCGTSSAAGAMKITVPSGTKFLHIHVAAWKGETVTLSVTPNENISTNKSISLTADDGISNSSPYTLSGTASSTNFYKVITFTEALNADTDFTFTATSGKRFVIWGVNSETTAVDNRTATTVTIDASGITNTNKFNGTDAGSLAATVKAGENTVGGASVTWSSATETVATINSTTGAITLVGEGSTTITASYAGDATYKPSSNTYLLNVTDENPAAVTIWSEDFSGYAANDVPSGGTNNYVCTDGASTTKVLGDAVAGGTAPELFIGKNKGAFTATIPLLTSTYGYNGDLTLKYKTNATELNVKTTTEGITIDGEASAGAGLTFNTKATHKITFKGVTTSTENITIVFTATNADQNVRLDDIVLKGVQAAVTKASTPVISPASGAVVSGTEVTISCLTEGVTIYYTTDGTDPTSGSTAYNPSSKPTVTAATTIKAIAIKDGLNNSDIATATYTIAEPCATPTFSPVAGEVEKGSTVTITTETAGATIYYTTDGSTPTTGSTVYSSAITINTNMTLKAIAVKDGLANSAVATAAYTVIDYVTLPFSFDGGKTDVDNTTGLIHEGLGSDYGSSPKLKFDGTGDYLILKINEASDVPLTFDIKGNGFSGGTFKVQTSADGVDYTDLETFTTLGDTEKKLFNLTSTVRYIKWIYTTKSSGNVALGNINLTATVNATITDADYATFLSDKKVNFTGTGIKAYTAKLNGNYVTLNEITKVPANTPVVIYKNVDATTNITVPSTTADADDASNNDLHVSDGTTATSANNVYVLAKKNDVVGFYKWAGANSLSAGKIYITVPAGAPEFLGFGDDATSINTLNVERGTLNGEVYNLAGQRVANPTKGLYIVNGKKVIIK